MCLMIYSIKAGINFESGNYYCQKLHQTQQTIVIFLANDFTANVWQKD